MVDKCNHSWKVISYRRKNKEKGFSEWVKISDKVICDKCETIGEIKIKNKEVKELD